MQTIQKMTQKRSWFLSPGIRTPRPRNWNFTNKRKARMMGSNDEKHNATRQEHTKQSEYYLQAIYTLNSRVSHPAEGHFPRSNASHCFMKRITPLSNPPPGAGQSSETNTRWPFLQQLLADSAPIGHLGAKKKQRRGGWTTTEQRMSGGPLDVGGCPPPKDKQPVAYIWVPKIGSRGCLY